jgi:hypothetical protein
MSFPTTEFSAKVQSLLSTDDWTNKDSELRTVAQEATMLQPSSGDLRLQLQQFQCRYHEHYAKQHNLQRFLANMVHFAVQTQSENPVADLASALEKKLIV